MKDQEIKKTFAKKLKEALAEIKAPANEGFTKLVDKYSDKLADKFIELLEKEEKKRTKKAEKLYYKEKKKAEKERINALKDQLFDTMPTMGEKKVTETRKTSSAAVQPKDTKVLPRTTARRRITKGRSSGSNASGTPAEGTTENDQ